MIWANIGKTNFWLFLLFIVISYGELYAQTPCLSPDGDTLYLGEYSIVRNHNAKSYNDFPDTNRGVSGLITDWGEEIYVSDSTIGSYLHPNIEVSDSLLHVFGKKCNSTPFAIHHYVSLNNGESWEFFADYIDTTMTAEPGKANAYCEDSILYTVWNGRYNPAEDTFIYFRASTDYGQTWPITAEIKQHPGHWRPARYGNVSGHGDTVFVSFIEDSVSCWRSFNGGADWEDFGYIASRVGIGYPPSITYDAGVVSIVYNDTYYYQEHAVLDVYYKNSFDHGETWSEPEFLGFYDDADGQWPEIDSDSLGNVAICWMDYVGTPYGWTGGIWCKVSHDSGQTWEEAVKINDGYRGWNGVDVIIDGDYVSVAWKESGENPYLFYCESWDGGETWGEPEALIYGANFMPVMVKHHDFVHLVWRKIENDRSFIKYIKNDDVTDIVSGNELFLPEQPVLLAYPNPFNSSVTFRLSDFKGGDIRIELYDIAGRLVDAVYTDRYGKAIWEPYKIDDRCLSSGIYFAKPVLSGNYPPQKVLFLK